MSINPRSLSPLHAPLGIPLSEEVQAEHISVDTDPWVRASFEVPERRLSQLDFQKDFVVITGSGAASSDGPIGAASRVPLHRFDCAAEEQRMKLSRLGKALFEPFSCLLETVDSLPSEDGRERMQYTPCMLEYFSEELGHTGRIRNSQVASSDNLGDGLADICSDSFYASTSKSAENVDSGPAEEGETVAAPVPAAAVSQAVISSDGVSVAHAVCAYDLSGCVPWACYTPDSFTPLSPLEVRFHRTHICSANMDRVGSVWSVHGAKPVPAVEIPRDGSCPYKSSSQLSLKDTGRFVLMESVEQSPLLMHYHGMSGALLRYWKSSKGHVPPDPQYGVSGQLVKLDASCEFLPRVYGGGTIKVAEDTETWLMESSLLRAPIFAHRPNACDFLLVRSRNTGKSAGGLSCFLREIENIFCVGQAEPLYRIDVPVVPRLHQSLSSRVMLEVRRYWLRAKTMPSFDFVNHLFIGERKSLLQRYFSDAVRDIQQKPGLPLSSSVTPEEACVVAGMKEGLRRLAERGIDRIFAISPMRIRNYVRDIEIFERSIPAHSRTPRIAHYCVQVENEMRSSPWNLTNDYWDVMTGKRGAMFQFSPLGDPSGGRGEGISFRKILKVDNLASLSSVGGLPVAKPIEMEDIRSKSKKELIAELVKLNVPERMWRAMSRWQLMRQLALLHGIEEHAEERFAPWKRKALHTEKIFEAWKKQDKALRADQELTTPDDSGDEEEAGKSDEPDNLESMMLDELMEEDKREETETDVVHEGNVTTRLQIVSAGRTKSTGNPWSKVTYVYGAKHIALYRKWKELEEEGASSNSAGITLGETGLPPASGWQAKVELSLKVHRRFQRIIKQAAEAGRNVPDVKRCSACHLFGHDSSFTGCPMLVRELGEGKSEEYDSRKRNRGDLEMSPVYD